MPRQTICRGLIKAADLMPINTGLLSRRYAATRQFLRFRYLLDEARSIFEPPLCSGPVMRDVARAALMLRDVSSALRGRWRFRYAFIILRRDCEPKTVIARI